MRRWRRLRAAVVLGRFAAVSALSLALWPAAGQTAGSACQVRLATLQGSYSGDCVAGLANGQGRAQGADRYEGGFRDGLPQGQGVYFFADGRRFEGEFDAGAVNGRARFFYVNGDRLEGQFRNNQLVGSGRMLRPSGETLVVEIRNGAIAVLASAAPAPVQPALAPVAPSASPAPSSAPAPEASAPPAPSSLTPPAAPPASADWAPRLDFDDLFPSFILASATRHPPGTASRSAGAADASATASRAGLLPRGDPLNRISDGARLFGEPEPPARATTATSRVAIAATNEGLLYMGDPWGLVGIRFANTRHGTRVTVRIEVDELAEPTTTEFVLREPGEHALYPRLRWKFDRLRQVAQPQPANVVWSVSVDGRPAGTRSAVARVRSIQDAPYFVISQRGHENLTWVFGSYVTEDAPWIDEVLRGAFAGRNIGAVGHQQGEAAVHAQVAAIYEHLRAQGFRYSSITTGSAKTERVASQIVRFPSDSVRTRQANCVDGTLLMASLLRKIDIEPLILLGPGHAMLGYYPTRNPKDGFVAVETTALERADFRDAVKEGGATYRKWQAEAANHPQFNTIPVKAVRAQGVMPIAR
jgi:hypothetical protein